MSVSHPKIEVKRVNHFTGAIWGFLVDDVVQTKTSHKIGKE
jgi:hypothetical protein